MPKEGRKEEKEGWVSSILFFVCCWFSARFGATSPCRSKLTINRNFKCLFWPTIPKKRRGNTKAKELAKVLRFGGGGPRLLSIAAAAAAAAERVRRNEKKNREKKSQSVFRETESCRQSRHRHKKRGRAQQRCTKQQQQQFGSGQPGPTAKQKKSAIPPRMLVVQNDFHQICRVSP